MMMLLGCRDHNNDSSSGLPLITGLVVMLLERMCRV